MKNESVKTITDGRRLSVQKVVYGEPFPVDTSEIREDMAKSIAGVISKLMPITQTSSATMGSEIVLTGNIYIFTPEQLSEYNKNIIEEYKRKHDD